MGRGKNNGDLALSCMVGGFDISQGIAKSNVLALKTPGAVVRGSGTVDLGEERLNLTLKARSALVGLADITRVSTFNCSSADCSASALMTMPSIPI